MPDDDSLRATNSIPSVTCEPVSDDRRSDHIAEIFGFHFSLQVEPYIYTVTERLSQQYKGGYWQFYALSNKGFYMAPEKDAIYRVACENGYEGDLSADALGITACLYAYSHLSGSNSKAIAGACAQQYHLLREYMLGHPEARGILRAID